MPNHIIQCKNVACECHAQKTLMTHQQLVEEWKEKVRKEWDQYGNGVFGKRLEDVLNLIEEAQLAAAKGAAEAGKVQRRPYEHHWNAAKSQSERQLKDYFKEV